MKKRARRRLPQWLRPKKQTLSLKNQFSIGLTPKKTKTFIEKTIRVLKSLQIQMKKRARHRLPQWLRPKKQTLSLKNQFSIGLRPKKTKTLIQTQFSIGLKPKKTNTRIKKSIFNRPETKKTKTLIEKSIFNRPEAKKTKTLIEKLIRVLRTL